MQRLIKNLTETYGPTGHEGQVRDVIKKEIQNHVDEIKVDYLGNLIALKKGTDKKGLRVMLAAHMDEIGVMVTEIDKNGFLRFTNVGGHSPHRLIGARVMFAEGQKGVIFHEHLEDIKELSLSKMYIDIGMGKEEAEKAVKIGDIAVFDQPMVVAGKNWLAKAMDDRIGCAILIEVLKRLKESPNDLYYVFTSQEEVGCRGARTSAYGIDPDLAFAVDVTVTGDTPEAKRMAVKLGGGTAIKVMDSTMITSPKVKDFLIKKAEESNIKYQLEVLERGGTDAGIINLVREGVPAGCLSIPCRYVHSDAEMVSPEDVEATVGLMIKFLTEDINLG